MRLNTTNTTAHPAICASGVNGGQEFTDSSTSGGRDEGEFWRAGTECKAAAQAIEGRLRTRSIRLVHDNDVGDLEDPRLHRLHLIATLGPLDNEQHIGEPRDADLGLPSTNGLHNDQIKPSRLNQDRGRSGNMRKRPSTTACRNGTREAAIVIWMLIDAHSITKERAAALIGTWINRQDRDAATVGAGDVGKGCGE
jgi:hypothetical protein